MIMMLFKLIPLMIVIKCMYDGDNGNNDVGNIDPNDNDEGHKDIRLW